MKNKRCCGDFSYSDSFGLQIAMLGWDCQSLAWPQGSHAWSASKCLWNVQGHRCALSQSVQQMRSSSRSLLFPSCCPISYFCKAEAVNDFQATGVPAISVPLAEPATVQQHKFLPQLETSYRESQKGGGLDSAVTEMLYPASILPAWSWRTQSTAESKCQLKISLKLFFKIQYLSFLRK